MVFKTKQLQSFQKKPPCRRLFLIKQKEAVRTRFQISLWELWNSITSFLHLCIISSKKAVFESGSFAGAKTQPLLVGMQFQALSTGMWNYSKAFTLFLAAAETLVSFASVWVIPPAVRPVTPGHVQCKCMEAQAMGLCLTLCFSSLSSVLPACRDWVCWEEIPRVSLLLFHCCLYSFLELLFSLAMQ